MLKIFFKKYKRVILMYFEIKNNCYHASNTTTQSKAAMYLRTPTFSPKLLESICFYVLKIFKKIEIFYLF